MFSLKFDATAYEPIIEFTAEMREEWFKICCENLSAEEVAAIEHAKKVEAARKHRALLEERHQYFLNAAGAKHNGMSVAEAKKYVRARAASSLRHRSRFWNRPCLRPVRWPKRSMSRLNWLSGQSAHTPCPTRSPTQSN